MEWNNMYRDSTVYTDIVATILALYKYDVEEVGREYSDSLIIRAKRLPYVSQYGPMVENILKIKPTFLTLRFVIPYKLKTDRLDWNPKDHYYVQAEAALMEPVVNLEYRDNIDTPMEDYTVKEYATSRYMAKDITKERVLALILAAEGVGYSHLEFECRNVRWRGGR